MEGAEEEEEEARNESINMIIELLRALVPESICTHACKHHVLPPTQGHIG